MSDGFAVELQEVVKRFGDVTAVDHISLQIRDGEFFSLLGPSGCGKTTTLRLIAGFEMPTSGQILIGGELQGYRPAFQRPVNTVFQHYALFPHMSVYDNVAFGLEMRGVPDKETKSRVHEALELVQLPGMVHRRPDQLSGGQQQRVALARALVNQPKVLLLDEPLGALDLKLRKAMQIELKALQHRVGITFIYVTHDQEEALTMSDRIAVIRRGRVLQMGAPEGIYEHPANRFVADFIGETNFIPGRVAALGPPVEVALDGGASVLCGWAEEGTTVGAEVTVSIRPERIGLQGVDDGGTGAELARLAGTITQAMYLGTDTRYVIEAAGGATLAVRMQNVGDGIQRHAVGDAVAVMWDPQHARVLID